MQKFFLPDGRRGVVSRADPVHVIKVNANPNTLNAMTVMQATLVLINRLHHAAVVLYYHTDRPSGSIMHRATLHACAINLTRRMLYIRGERERSGILYSSQVLVALL